MNAASLGEASKPLLAHQPEEADRVVPGDLPRVGVDPAEQVAVCSSHDQRRFMASSWRGASASGSLGRTVKLRRAFIAAARLVDT